MDLVNSVLRISRDNAVDQRAVDSASLLEPSLEIFAKIPESDILLYALLQLLSIKEDQLTRQNDQALGRITLEMFISMIQKLSQLARIRRGRLVFQTTIWVEGDTCFSRIGYHETDVGIFRKGHVSIKVGIRVKSSADHIDHLD